MRLSNIITDLYEQANPTDAKFWEIVKNARWTSDHNYERIKYQWMRELSPPQAEGLRRKFNKFQSRLDNKLTDIVHGVGDDSFSDVVAHIIGMGKQAYGAAMKDPSLAQRLIDANEYVENFGYAFPDKDDYNLIEPKYLIKQATGYLEELSDLTSNRSAIRSQQEADILRDMIKRLRAAESGDFKKAIQDWDGSKYKHWGKIVDNTDHDVLYGPPNLMDELKAFLKR